MDFYGLKPNYNREPCIKISRYDNAAWEGYDSIAKELKNAAASLGKERVVITVECYPCVRENEIIANLKKRLPLAAIFNSDDAAMDEELITEKMQMFLTDDRVFGFLYPFELQEFFVGEKIEAMRLKIEALNQGIILLIGFGASLVYQGDILVYANLARWEIQQRFRSGEMGNWRAGNQDEDVLKKYKRGFFLEWRMADRLKKNLYEKIDYLLDTNAGENPKMITGEAFLSGLNQAVNAPFRVVPYFDPGVWGGQWMKTVFDLNSQCENYAWSFDGVPEENSLYLQYGQIRIEIPAIDAVLYKPVELLGEGVYARFGAEFPIRFDMLDTVNGGNLSLQVHPLTSYIQEKFGMHYTQDESYYLLDANEGSVVYLGLKEGVVPEEMVKSLKEAQAGGVPFDADKYVNSFPAKKHDHFSIPAGTIHCSGANTMVLEISATPYIFTFKLWDWGRLGLDGLPRPVHIEHGEKVIQWDRDTDWVSRNLINLVEPVSSGDGWKEEKTGLNNMEFLETHRCWITKQITWDTQGNFNMLNLVSGREAVVESPSGAFEPFVLHYAETLIIPASTGYYTVRPYGESFGKEIALIKAYVRGV